LELFMTSRKPMSLNCFRNERKTNVRIIFEVSKTNEFELLSQGAKANVGIVF